jgi:hypothetical protein
VEFAGIRPGWPFASTHIVPARDIRLDQESQAVQVEHPRRFVRKAPRSNPEAELAEIEKEEIDHLLRLLRAASKNEQHQSTASGGRAGQTGLADGNGHS